VLSRSERLGLRVQEAVAQALIPLTYHSLEAWMRSRGYRIPGLRRVRREFAAQLGRGPGPWLICANHLTLVDSLVIQWALAPGWRLFLRRHLFAWNLPDRQNISRTRFLRTLGYLGKCLPVVRRGTPEEARRTLEKVAFLLSRGQTVVVFPEGGRSPDGSLQPGNIGPALMATRAGVPIIPAALKETDKIMPRDRGGLHRGRVQVDYGAPIHPGQFGEGRLDKSHLQAFTDAVMQAIEVLQQTQYERVGEVAPPRVKEPTDAE